MKIIISVFFLGFISCIGGTSNFSEPLSDGYIYSNQGEGENGIYGGSRKIKLIYWIKKYSDNGKHITICQADTSILQSPHFNYGNYKKNSYYLEDRFYIIDIKKENLLGPFKAEEFLTEVRDLNIVIHW